MSTSSPKTDHPTNILLATGVNNAQVPKDDGVEETTRFNENTSKATKRPSKRKRVDEFNILPDAKKVAKGTILAKSIITSFDKENETLLKMEENTTFQSYVTEHETNVSIKHETVTQINDCHDNTKENLKSLNDNENVEKINKQSSLTNGKTLVLSIKKLNPVKGISENKANNLGKTIKVEEPCIVRNNKPYKCDKCNLCFSRRAQLNSHQTEHEVDSSSESDKEEEKSRSCNTCEKSFKYPSGLRAHELTHTGSTPFKCAYCEASFSQKSHLKRHESIHLKNSKKFKCSKCKLRFRLESYLKTHQRIHKADKPFVCSDCNKAFTQKSHLNEHKKIHLDKKEFICNECYRGFHQIYKLRDHIIKVHNSISV